MNNVFFNIWKTARCSTLHASCKNLYSRIVKIVSEKQNGIPYSFLSFLAKNSSLTLEHQRVIIAQPQDTENRNIRSGKSLPSMYFFIFFPTQTPLNCADEFQLSRSFFPLDVSNYLTGIFVLLERRACRALLNAWPEWLQLINRSIVLLNN